MTTTASSKTMTKKPRVKKPQLTMEEWESRFKKHIDAQYYTGVRASCSSSSNSLARTINNPYVVKGE